jgi:hypothetical protein
MFTSSPKVPKLSPAPLLVSRPLRINIGYNIFIYLLVTVLGIAHSENVSADFHHLYLKRRGLLQGSAFWSFIDTTSPVAEKFRKNPQNWDQE